MSVVPKTNSDCVFIVADGGLVVHFTACSIRGPYSFYRLHIPRIGVKSVEADNIFCLFECMPLPKSDSGS